MRKEHNLLGRLTVGLRCPMDWEAMEGEGATRFCDQCRKTVTDLRELTAEEVEEFVRNASGREACVRLQRRADGRLVTKGCPRTVESRMKRAKGVATGMAAGVVLSSCAATPDLGGAVEHPEGAEPVPGRVDHEEPDASDFPVLMGVMICPEDSEKI